MTTSHVREILPTIVSRSRVLKFHLFSTEYLEEKLRELYPDSDGEIIQKVAKLSLGRTGQALDLMNHPDMLAYFLKLYKDILYLLDTNNIVERFAYVEDMVEDEKLRRDFLGVMTHVLRSKVLEGVGGIGEVGGIGTCGAYCGAYCEMLSKTQDAGILLKQNVNTRLVLENLMLV